MSLKSKRSKKLNCPEEKSISYLIDSFTNGFFIEVNCHFLPEENLDQLAYQVYQFIEKQGKLTRSLIYHSFLDQPFLTKYVNKIYVGDFEETSKKKKEMNIILYKTTSEKSFNHQLVNEDEKHNLGHRWSLPNEEFESLWETLEFDYPYKCQLIQYVFTLIRFNQANIDRKLIHSNQTILLYGPPGCGKTSLCKGLAQKISIRMKQFYEQFYFYELNSSSLFSKWFSESSHNLTKFFEEMIDICSNPSIFTIILIDEIESLSISRKCSLSSNEPSDMLRVVNTLLTQIDRLKSFSNILILTTSNFIEIIDQALIDRSDLILFINSPSIETIYQIYRDCFDELIRKNLLFDYDDLDKHLWNLAKLSEGFSGRILRKLPILAFSTIREYSHFISSDELFKSIEKQLIEQKKFLNYFHKFQR